ncbi:hypothetical protein BKA83DRAFT_202366 [Pisolithus microcarpus]|nr:hypothetical protein BKA83DRAFT_202366 [Pisolithus microcarpus]
MHPSRLSHTTQCILSPHDEPLDLLCRKFNVAKVTLPPGSPIPSTIDMRVIKDAHVPSHVLAVFDTQESERGPSFQPIIVPIRADLYTKDFRKNIIPQSPPGTPYPVPQWIANLGGQYVTLPVVPTLVPHASSIPLFEVIEEFPAFPAMAQSMARLCADDQLISYIRFNQGLWKNILALGPRDLEFIRVVQTAWNATIEARRIRQRGAMARTPDM